MSIDKNRITPENITSLKGNEIIVVGTNERGVHGAGAAKFAYNVLGARRGQGFGLMGKTFGIPTKDENIKTLPLSDIQNYVNAFISFAQRSPQRIYLVTAIGTGLAGLEVSDIAPMFYKALTVENIHLPLSFWEENIKFVQDFNSSLEELKDNLKTGKLKTVK